MRLVNALLIVTLSVAILTGCGSVAEAPPTPESIADELGGALAVIEEKRVVILVNRDDCRLLRYRSGTFSANDAEWCLSYVGEPVEAFSAAATEDFEELVVAADVGRARFWSMTDVAYSADGGIERATFEFAYDFGTELFVFHPGYRLPADDPGERWHETINDDWYLVRVDWN